MNKCCLAVCIFCLLFSISCKKKHTSAVRVANKIEKKRNLSAIFLGNWVSQDYLVNLKSGRTAKSLDYNNYCTELVFRADFGDSLLIKNEDLAQAKIAFKVISIDSILVKEINRDSNTAIVYNIQQRCLQFADKENNKIYTFQKVDSVKYGKEDCFRKMLNDCTLAGTYRLFAGGKMIGNKITLEKDGTIKGWEKFTHYYQFVNGDKANSDDNVIEFTKGKSVTETFAWLIKENTLQLYTTTKPEKKGNKPSSQKQVLRYQLNKVD
jgi:hypothetical protein